MEAILAKLSWALLAAMVGFVIWATKGLIKTVFENRDKIKDGYFKNLEQDKSLVNLEKKVEVHELRIDLNEANISNLVTTHNNTSCGRQNKIEIKV